MAALGLLFGALVGLSLGLTGGGGAMFAVPLLVYGLNVPPREAVAISLASVGATALVGFVQRWRQGEVEVRTGLLFAAAGMAGAPLGTWLASFVPDAVLLLAFAALIVVVALRLWRQAARRPETLTSCSDSGPHAAPTCQRDARGALRLTSRCALLLLLVGMLTGVLSGLFGVGGGFVIVPALVLFSGMRMHQAVGTSLLVIALVSGAGIASQLGAGRTISWELTGLFVAGGIGGLSWGQRIGRRLSGPTLQRVFVVALIAVALLLVARNLPWPATM